MTLDDILLSKRQYKFHGKISHSMETLHKFIAHRGLTDCGSVKPHGVIYQGQHWLKPWNATWRRQATT